MAILCRFAACSDVHYKAEGGPERERFEKGMRDALRYASGSAYPFLDAVFVVGDFANSGSESEMRLFRQSLDTVLPARTRRILTMASHEFKSEGGEQGAHERFARIFGQEPDLHTTIGGLHFISVTTENGCRIGEKKQAWLKEALKAAAADSAKKPIFVFQHPHLSGTVYGSINWGEDDINAILMDYPQVVDFSGHSHAPINDPRSIHQRYFTSVGTGSFSYFELDEFDMYTGTVPPDAHECAQFHIVEVADDMSVRILPYDVLTGRFFEPCYEIRTPWDPDSFVYTDARYRSASQPRFPQGSKPEIRPAEGGVTVRFRQAQGEERPDSYTVTVKTGEGTVKKQLALFSSYYLYNMPAFIECGIALEPGAYTLQVRANSFWRTVSEPICTQFRLEKERI